MYRALSIAGQSVTAAVRYACVERRARNARPLSEHLKGNNKNRNIVEGLDAYQELSAAARQLLLRYGIVVWARRKCSARPSLRAPETKQKRRTIVEGFDAYQALYGCGRIPSVLPFSPNT